MSRLTKYGVGVLSGALLATGIAYASNISSLGTAVVQQAASIQPAQLQENIAHPLPATSIPTPTFARSMFSTQDKADPAQPLTSIPLATRDALDDESPAVPDLVPTLALSPTLPITPSATVVPEDAPLAIAELGGKGPALRGQFIVQTKQLDFYLGASSLSVDQLKELAPRVDAAFEVAENRFGEQIYHRVSLGYYYPIKSNLRGMAFTDQARAELYYRSGESLNRALAPAVHELAHHLQEQRYGHDVQRRADTILLEGGATWIAGDSWLPMCGAATWKERARQLRAAGVPLELTHAERYGANNAYELWASFVDFTLDTYGPKTYRALYTSSRGRALGSADYQGVTSKSLDELTQEWRAWIDQ